VSETGVDSFEEFELELMPLEGLGSFENVVKGFSVDIGFDNASLGFTIFKASCGTEPGGDGSLVNPKAGGLGFDSDEKGLNEL